MTDEDFNIDDENDLEQGIEDLLSDNELEDEEVSDDHLIGVDEDLI